jgi:hypothetical protein
MNPDQIFWTTYFLYIKFPYCFNVDANAFKLNSSLLFSYQVSDVFISLPIWSVTNYGNTIKIMGRRIILPKLIGGLRTTCKIVSFFRVFEEAYWPEFGSCLGVCLLSYIVSLFRFFWKSLLRGMWLGYLSISLCFLVGFLKKLAAWSVAWLGFYGTSSATLLPCFKFTKEAYCPECGMARLMPPLLLYFLGYLGCFHFVTHLASD